MISNVSLVLKLNIRACLKRQRNWQRVGLKNDVQIKGMEELTLSYFFHREYKQFHVISLKTHLVDIRWHKYQEWRLFLWTVTSPSALWRGSCHHGSTFPRASSQAAPFMISCCIWPFKNGPFIQKMVFLLSKIGNWIWTWGLIKT